MFNTKKSLLFLLIILSPLVFFKEIEQYKNFQKGLKFIKDGNYQEARELFSKLRDEKSRFNKNLSIYLSGEKLEDTKSLEEKFNLGNYYFKNKEYDKAKDYYWEAMLLTDDLNIKKNYELSIKKIKEKQEEEQKQEKQEKQEQNKDKQDKNHKENNEQNTENNMGNNQNEEQENSRMENNPSQKNNKNTEEENINSDDEFNENIEDNLNRKDFQEKEKKEKEELEKSLEQEDSNLEKNPSKEIEATYEENSNMNLEEVERYFNILSDLEKRDLRNNHRAIRRGEKHD